MITALIGLLLAWSTSTLVHAASLTAKVDRTEILLDEHVLLTLSLENSDVRLRAEGVAPNVDLTLLSADFDVGIPKADFRYNIYRDRGRATSELQVELFPKRAGKLQIPGFHIDSLSTEPIALTVQPVPAAAAPRVFVRAGTNKPTLWQREQLVAYLDVYARVALAEAKLGGELAMEPTALDELEHRRLAVSKRTEQHNGLSYEVMRTTWSAFPIATGPLRIYFPDVWIVTAAGEKLRLPREQTTVTVQPLPNEIPPTLMVGKPTLALTVTQDNPAVQGLNAWQVNLSAPVSARNLPAELLTGPAPGVQLYADAPRVEVREFSDGIVQVGTYGFTAFALHQGELAMPELRVPYFDPEIGRIAEARLTGPVLHITQPASSVANPIAIQAPQNGTTETAPRTPTLNPWMLATVAFAVLWLATLVLWRGRQPRATARPSRSVRNAAVRSNTVTRPLEAKLLAALGGKSLEEGLQAWEQRFGRDESVRATVRVVQALYYDKKANSDAHKRQLDADVQRAIATIGAARTAATPSDDPWAPESFTPSLRRIVTPPQGRT